MEWGPAVISGIAAAVSVFAAWRATAADRKRQESRRIVGAAIDHGNMLHAWLKEYGNDHPEAEDRYERWEDEADAAVRAADLPQIGFYHAEITGVTKLAGIVDVRLARLREILTRL